MEDFSELKAIFQEGIFNVQSALNWTFQSFYPPLKMSKSQARLDIMYRSKRGISWTFLILCVFWNTNTILRLHYKFTHCKSGESISRTLVLEPVYIGVSTNSFPFVPFFRVLATVSQTLAYFAYFRLYYYLNFLQHGKCITTGEVIEKSARTTTEDFLHA